MSRATLLPPARPLVTLAAACAVALTATLAFGIGSAEAAKPCWERVIDDWVDNGSIDGNYSVRCVQAAKRHVPEDIRTYTDIMDVLDAYRQAKTGERSLAIVGGSDGTPASGSNPNRSKGAEPNVNPSPASEEEPIPEALRTGTTDASSIPLPLIVLAGLALLLMAAGGAGFAHRKLQARRITSRDS
jgi:hypothetical protein